MKFVFLTRVTRIQNVQAIKDHLKEVFESSEVDYQHILIADLTVANTKEDFEKFIDEKTNVFVVDKKREDDKYCNDALDAVIQTIPKDEDCWIYILDDDNTISNDFAELAKEMNEEPVIVFNIKMKPISNGFNGIIKAPLVYKKALFHIDIANYIVHRSVFEKCRFRNNIKSQWCDGVFVEKVLHQNIPIKYIDKFYSSHNGL